MKRLKIAAQYAAHAARYAARAAIFAALAASFAAPAAAWEPDEVLSDPALEARARALESQIRCVVCENQSIGDSDVSRAKDLRLLVRERIAAGDTDAETVGYLRDRYGDSVLMSTPFNQYTALVWLAPGALLIFGVLGFYTLRRTHPAETAQLAPPPLAPLTPEEQARLAALTPRDPDDARDAPDA